MDGYRIQSTFYQKVLEYFCKEIAWQRYHHLIPNTKKRPGKNITGSEGGAQQVCRALDTATALVEHMGVYHCRTHVSMPEEFLDGADVIPGFKEMGRKGVATLIVTLLILRRWPRSGTRTIPSADKRSRWSDGCGTKPPTVLWSSSPMAYRLPSPRGCLTLSRAPRCVRPPRPP